MPRYIDVERFCREICRCAGLENGCDKSKCPIWNAPAEDVVPAVHGEWIPYTKEFREIGSYGKYYSYVIPLNYRCSVCNRISENIEPYCHCGAKMDGETIKSMKRAGDSAEKAAESLKNVIGALEHVVRCVRCVEIIPEGRQVCPGCETGGDCDG